MVARQALQLRSGAICEIQVGSALASGGAVLCLLVREAGAQEGRGETSLALLCLAG